MKKCNFDVRVKTPFLFEKSLFPRFSLLLSTCSFSTMAIVIKKEKKKQRNCFSNKGKRKE
jgi:hypothetical protein